MDSLVVKWFLELWAMSPTELGLTLASIAGQIIGYAVVVWKTLKLGASTFIKVKANRNEAKAKRLAAEQERWAKALTPLITEQVKRSLTEQSLKEDVGFDDLKVDVCGEGDCCDKDTGPCKKQTGFPSVLAANNAGRFGG